jgi:hypothetical protein
MQALLFKKIKRANARFIISEKTCSQGTAGAGAVGVGVNHEVGSGATPHELKSEHCTEPLMSTQML